MFRKRNIFVVVVVLAASAAIYLMYILQPRDAISVREFGIDKSKLEFVQSLEKENGYNDDALDLHRRYVPIEGEKKYCVFAFFDPPIPINEADHLYCFSNETGEYTGRI